MRLTRARYITICQQFLVTAVVLVVGLSAAGVMTLQIVAPEAPQALGLAPAINVSDGYADTAPVTPKVREVKVSGIDAAAARNIPGVVTAPDKQARSKKAPKKLAALSAPTAVHGYATVGVTWKPGTELAEDQISVQVRTRKGATWSGWTTAAYHDEHGPDAGSAEARKVRPGTDAVVVGDVDEVQMRAETQDGVAPQDLELAVVDPGTGTVTKQPAAIDTATLPAPAAGSGAAPGAAPGTAPGTAPSAPATAPADGATDDAAADTVALSALKVSPKPTIYSRAQWGANEALRDKSSLRYGTIKTGFIHHTVNANNYSASQVPALIRGIYAYHTQSRGWSDIGYNFLVDRFGRIWEGRYGGVDRPVVGAHTRGYNEYSFAMSAIGNFDIAQPPQAVLDAYASLFAWKLSLSNIRADATHLWVKDRYLYAINGHRDVGQTACPGRYLYAKIPSIRVAAQAIENGAQGPVDPVTLPPLPAPSGLPAPTQAPAAAVPQPARTLPKSVNLVGTGWPDLLVATTAGAVAVVPTQGVLDYNPVTSNRGPWQKMGIIAAVGDLTGDHKSDVVAKDSTTKVLRVYPGDGQGHVGKGIAPTTAFKRVDMIVGAHDFNRDGHTDVVARDRKSGDLLLFRGTGDGHFKAPRTLHRRWTFTQTVGVGDLNGDRQPDLVATVDGKSLYFVPGAKGGKALGRSVPLGTLPSRTNALLGWGDLNRDGKPDLMARFGNLTTMYAGTGTTRLGSGIGPFDSLAGLAKLSMAQMAGSGAADVVGRNADGRLVVIANNGAGGVSAPISPNLKVTGVTQVLDVGDWNRDGKGDVVVRSADRDSLVLYPGLGNGRFGRGRSLGAGWKPVSALAAVGDVTGDGYPDLLGKTATGPMTIFPGAGTSGYRAPMLAPSSMRTFNQIGAAPWSSSGAVIPSVSGMFVPLVGTTAANALRMANGAATASYDTSVGAGDVTGDGVADLLAREKGTGTIWLLPGKTSGGFGPRMWVAAGFGGYRLVG